MTARPYLRQVKASELTAGQIVHFYGARFRLRDDRQEHADRGNGPVFTITGDWIDGEQVGGYFGPNTPWRFQGNDNAAWSVEFDSPPAMTPEQVATFAAAKVRADAARAAAGYPQEPERAHYAERFTDDR
jgi:hypothetical protein